MIVRLLLALQFSLALATAPAFAGALDIPPVINGSHTFTGPVTLPPATVGGTAFQATGTPASRTAAARAADTINPRDYGAIGDGTSHPVGSVLGINTLAGLAAYSADGGVTHPYSFVSGSVFGVPSGPRFNLVPEVTANVGATSITFQSTATIGIQVPVSTNIGSGASALQLGDLAVTSDQTAIVNGTLLGGTGIQSGTTVTSAPAGYAGVWTFSISKTTNANLTQLSSYVTAYVRPAAGAYTLPVLSAAMQVGDIVTDTGGCVAAGAQVDFVNPGKNEIRLSKATVSQCPAQDVLTFTPSWLTKVSAGMTMQGPVGAVPNGETVSAVNQSTGVVSFPTPLTGSISAQSSFLNTGSPTIGQQVTFSRAFTDAEATAMEMDGLAIQASVIKAMSSPYGGCVENPNAATYLTSFPIILPLQTVYGQDQPTICLGGRPLGFPTMVLSPATDFGPGSAVLSCGDPTAKISNQRGLYSTGSTLYCNGELHDIVIRPPVAFGFVTGLRSTWAGVPVAMDGVKEGNRLDWTNVRVPGFYNNMLATIDHTVFRKVWLYSGMCGLRMDDSQTGLFGNDTFEDDIHFAGNSQAGVCVAGDAFLSGKLTDIYMGGNGYGFWCEAWTSLQQCLAQTTMDNINAESIGCGFIADGGIQDGFTANGGTRTIADLRETNNYHTGPLNGFGNPVPVGGCQWHAYYDVALDGGHVIEGIPAIDFPQQAGAFAHILRVGRLDEYTNTGQGGFAMRGQGVANAITNARSYGEDVVTGPFGNYGGFPNTGSWRYVSLETSAWKARPMPFQDGATNSLAIGQGVEWNTTESGGFASVQRAGTTANAAFAGVSLQAWANSPNPNGNMPIIAYAGANVPLLTTVAATVGEMVIPDAAHPGQFVSTSTATGAAGLMWQAGSAGVNYGQLLQGRN